MSTACSFFMISMILFDNVHIYVNDISKQKIKYYQFVIDNIWTISVIGIYRDGFLLYWLTYTYPYSEKNFKDTATVEITEAFPENLRLFGMEVKNQARQ